MSNTPQQIRAALELTITLGQAIAEAGPKGIPSGTLYAAVMSHGISLEVYQGAINLLKRTKIVKESNHLLTIQIKGQ